MPLTVLSEWLLLEIDTYISVLNELRLQIFNTLTSLSISLARLILQLLKRTVGIIKTWFKESKIEEWFKTILHESYLSLFEGLYIFLYALHFFRAFLTLVDYFSDQGNKNLVEVYKLLYACFKIFISILMLIFLIVMIAHGFAPLGMIAYEYIKTLFRLYTFSKFAINFITLGFSFYQLKNGNNSPDHDWLKAQYKANLKKHFEILLVGGLITLTLTIVSLGLVSGPWLWIMIAAASIFFLVDMAKAIYYHINGCYVQEPEVAKLTQQNPFIDVSINDYYYRKCRNGRLKADDIETNRVYLLKEIAVKILQLKTKLDRCSSYRISFFSEKSKIEAKIEGLKQVASTLLTDDHERNEMLRNTLVNALEEDYQSLIVTESAQALISKSQIENLINELKDNSSEETLLDEFLYVRDRFKEKCSQKNMFYSQSFRQSFFRKKGDCEDIYDACEVFNELQKKTNEPKSAIESSSSTEVTDITLATEIRLVLV